MNPDHFSDPIFARCYQQWQARPTSAAFVGVADVLRVRGAFEDAVQVCREGLRHNPGLVIGRLVLAQALEALGRRTDAHAVVLGILADAPGHTEAGMMAARLHPMTTPEVEPAVTPHEEGLPLASPAAAACDAEAVPQTVPLLPVVSSPHAVPPLWETITMARLYAAQGHRREAERVYRALLRHNPRHPEAQVELEQLTDTL